MSKIISNKGELPVVGDGECVKLKFTAPTFETRTKKIVIEEEWVEYIVTPAVIELESEDFSYELGGRWEDGCCEHGRCVPELCYNDDVVEGKRAVTRVISPASIETIIHLEVIETIEYEYALTPGNTEWTTEPCAGPKRG